MKLLVHLIVLAVIVVALPVRAAQLDLTAAYQHAVEYDARLRSAKADNLMYKEEIGKARSQFRPNVRLNASRGRSATQHGYLGRFYPADFYNTVNYGVSVRQSLFNLSNVASYKQAKIIAAKSDVEVEKEQARHWPSGRAPPGR